MIEDINVGSVPNDGTGDALRNAFIKVKNNDEYLDNKFSGYVETSIFNSEIDAINSEISGLTNTYVSGATYSELTNELTLTRTDGGEVSVEMVGIEGPVGPQGPQGVSVGKSFFFNISESSDVAPYKVLNDTISSSVETTVFLDAPSGDSLLESFLSPELNATFIPSGVQRFFIHALKETEHSDLRVYVTLELTDALGVSYGTVLTSNESLISWIDDTTPIETVVDFAFGGVTINPTDRMLCKIYVRNGGGANREITLFSEGIENYSYVISSLGVSYINTFLTGATYSDITNELTLTRTDDVDISVEIPNTYVSGATFSELTNELTLTRTDGIDISVELAGGGAAGLVSGGFTNSMKNADDLTALPAITKGPDDIVLGNNARIFNSASTDIATYFGSGIVIGRNAKSDKTVDYNFVAGFYGGISIGDDSKSIAGYDDDGGAVAIGRKAIAAPDSVAIGGSVVMSTTGDANVAIGNGANSMGAWGVAIGRRAIVPGGYGGIAIGTFALANSGVFANASIAIGEQSKASANRSITLGSEAKVDNTTHVGAIAIGNESRVSAPGAVALGDAVTSVAWDDSVTVRKLAMLDYATLDFADDTAAAAGGVPLGGVYHSTGVLKIRIV